MYDDIAEVYDKFVAWDRRLAREIPLLLAWLDDAEPVADVACGTGQHALALAETGRQVVGFDPSGPALARARAAAPEGASVRFEQAAFGALAYADSGPFEAAYSLGNSLPHVLTQPELQAACDDLAALVRPGGKLLLHLRNLPLARTRGERWLPVMSHREADGTDWLFQRLYDFLPDDLVAFQFAIFQRPPGGDWSRRVERTTLRGWRPRQLTEALSDWREVQFAAELTGAPFEPDESGDLFVFAVR